MPYVDLELGSGVVWEVSQSVSFQDRLALKFTEVAEDGQKCSGLILDCTEAKVVMVRVTTNITIAYAHPVE
jgi:hypothetical protein